MKILFLDIDGVLNNFTALENQNCTMGEGLWNGDTSCEGSGFDENNVRELKRILERTGADIVISSSWRKLHDLDQLRTVFKNWGVDTRKIIGATPETDRGHRGQEVNLWLSMFARNGREVNTWAILDDDSDFHDDQPLFKTDFNLGLTADIADAVIQHLGENDL